MKIPLSGPHKRMGDGFLLMMAAGNDVDLSCLGAGRDVLGPPNQWFQLIRF